MAQDLRYAARTLAKSPGFATVALLSLALGMGANTAIFSLIDGVMLRMLPVRDPEQLMFADRNQVEMGQFKGAYTIAPSVFRRMQDKATSLAGLCSAGGQVRVGVAWDGQTDLASGQFVSSN